MSAKKTDTQMMDILLKQSFHSVAGQHDFSGEIIEGFEKLNSKFSLSQLSQKEQEIFFINFFRAVYSRLLRQFSLRGDWTDDVPISNSIKKQLAVIPDIQKHYFATIKSLQQKMLSTV